LGKKILIRLDASAQIGTGHLMRCLTLANEAKHKGWKSCFVLRDPNEGIIELITSFDHRVKNLSSFCDNSSTVANASDQGNWLSVSQMQDAEDTKRIVLDYDPEWIIVDHYALDANWLAIIKKCDAKIMVIDDIGNRELICDILIDQNLGASVEKYQDKVPKECKLLLGPGFALLRNEFKEWRERSLHTRFDRKIKNVLITMGGADEKNYTLRVLKELSKSKNAANTQFTVVIGSLYMHQNELNGFVETTKLNISVLSNVANMAEVMSAADLCIGAAGSTSWERCCLGLPSITLAIADNQLGIVDQLVKNNCTLASNLKDIVNDFNSFFTEGSATKLMRFSKNSASISDGRGVQRVLDQLEHFHD